MSNLTRDSFNYFLLHISGIPQTGIFVDVIAQIVTVMDIMTNLAPIQEEESFVSCAVKRDIYILNAHKNIVYAVVQKMNPIGWYIFVSSSCLT